MLRFYQALISGESMGRVIVVLIVSAVALFAQDVPNPPKEFDGKSWWDHVKVLADDNMEGRETGSAGR